MKSFYERFRYSIDATNGTVEINKATYEDLVNDAFKMGFEHGKKTAGELFEKMVRDRTEERLSNCPQSDHLNL